MQKGLFWVQSPLHIIMDDKKMSQGIYITLEQLADELGASEDTVKRLVDKGDLPHYSYGSNTTKKKGWHRSVLEAHAIDRWKQDKKLYSVT